MYQALRIDRVRITATAYGMAILIDGKWQGWSPTEEIMHNGRRTVIVVDAEEWERRTRRSGSLADFFKASRFSARRIACARRTREFLARY